MSGSRDRTVEAEAENASPAPSLGWIAQSIASWLLVWIVVALWVIAIGSVLSLR